MKMKNDKKSPIIKKGKIIITFSLFILVISGWIIYQKPRYNYAASCANCRSFIYQFFDKYATSHDGWYPRGGKTPMDSLAKLIDEVHNVHFFTSHAFQSKLSEYWLKNKTFSSEFCCYRYNEGLREDDPSDFIMMYYYKPTNWECQSHKYSELDLVIHSKPYKYLKYRKNPED